MDRDRVTTAGYLSPAPAGGLAALLDLPAGTVAEGWRLPPLWHRVYLLDAPRQSELGPDGHPVHGIPEPPRPGLHRMYAGGRVTTHRPLCLGAPATSTIEVTGVRERTGRSGPMTIVTTTRTIEQHGTVAVTDEVDILYRDPTPLPAPGSAAPPVAQSVAHPAAHPAAGGGAASRGAGTTRTVDVDETVLFRFSALTFNAHRIHYDVDYCRREGYAGLVVHGPLQALLMAEQARTVPADAPATTAADGPTRFEYRLVAPLLLGQGLVVGAVTGDDGAVVTEVRDATGRQTATGLLRRYPAAVPEPDQPVAGPRR